MPHMRPHVHLDLPAAIATAAFVVLFGALWRPTALRLQDSDRWRHVGEAMEIIY